MLRLLLALSTVFVGIHAIVYPLQGIQGSRLVPTGAIAHCGTDSGQQCFYAEPNLSYLVVENPDNADIACDYDNNVCVFAIDFDKNQKVRLPMHCFGGKSNSDHQGSANVSINHSHHYLRNTYGKFKVYPGDMQLKWESDKDYTGGDSHKDVYSYKKADSLIIKCNPN